MNRMLTKFIFILASSLLVLTLFCASETVVPPPPPIIPPVTDFVSLKCFDGDTVKYELPPGMLTDSGVYVLQSDQYVPKSSLKSDGTIDSAIIIPDYTNEGINHFYIIKKIPYDTIIMTIELQVTLRTEAGFLPPLTPGTTWVYLQFGASTYCVENLLLPSDSILKTITVLAADTSSIILSVKDSIIRKGVLTGTRSSTVNTFTDTITWNDSAIVLDPRIGLSAPNFYCKSCTSLFTYNNQDFLLGESVTSGNCTSLSDDLSGEKATIKIQSFRNIGLVLQSFNCGCGGYRVIMLIAFNNTPFLGGHSLP